MKRETGTFVGDDEGQVLLSGDSSETVLTKFEKPLKMLGPWRYVMGFPEDGKAETGWDFVGAHVEDQWRKKPCPLAEKAWKQLSTKVMVGYGGDGGLPQSMPGRLASWKRFGRSGFVWTEK